MAKYHQLTATPREVVGKKVKKLRRVGLVPGVVYGPQIDAPRSVSVDAHDFDRVYRTVGNTALVELAVDGGKHTVFVREVQLDPLGKQMLHIDFYAPNMTSLMVASVPLAVVGELAGTVDGVITHGRQDVDVRAMPQNFPQQIEVDISDLNDDNATITVANLTAPPDCEIVTPGEEMVVKLEKPQLPAEAEEALEPTAQEALAAETGDMPAELEQVEKPLKEES